MYATHFFGLLTSACLLPLVANAGGKIYQFDSSGTVIQVGGSDWIGFTSPADVSSNANDLSVALEPTTRYVDIIPDSSSANIPRLTFTAGPSSAEVKIYLGADGNPLTSDFDTRDLPPVTSGLNLRGLDASALYQSQFYGGITEDFGVQCTGSPCNGTAYYLKVGRLVRFDMGGTMWGDITVAGATGWSPLVVVAESMSDEASLTVNHGSVTRVETTGVTSNPDGAGDLKLSMTVSDGNIGTIVSTGRITGYGGDPIQVPNGKIGTISAAKTLSQFNQPNHPNNTNPMIRAKNGIDSIEAASVSGYISANYFAGGTGEIHRLVTTLGNVGNLSSTKIQCAKLARSTSQDLVDIKGDLEGELVIDDMDTSSVVRIGGRILSSGLITIPAGKLKGSIVLNATNATDHLLSVSNAGSWEWYWAGDITVGGTAINNTSVTPPANPYYATPSSYYGGGSVAVAPFFEHRADCTGWSADFGDETDPIKVAQTSLSGIGGQTLRPLNVGFFGRLVAGVNLAKVEM